MGQSSRPQDEKCSLFGYRCLFRHNVVLVVGVICTKVVSDGFLVFYRKVDRVQKLLNFVSRFK